MKAAAVLNVNRFQERRGRFISKKEGRREFVYKCREKSCEKV
jgi:hypothetical protein